MQLFTLLLYHISEVNVVVFTPLHVCDSERFELKALQTHTGVFNHSDYTCGQRQVGGATAGVLTHV